MNYNSELKKLILPEYGRNIHNMVDHCVSISNKGERQRCAHAIINTMGNLFPHLRDISDFKHILWDHLAIMSDFRLDIDYPYEVIKKENLYSKPPRIRYNNSRFLYRHYGKIIEQMIEKANSLEKGEERDYLISLLANQMKKSYLVWNKESVEDSKIFSDLDELSGGQIRLSGENLKLTESREILARNNQNNNTNNTNTGNKKNHSRKNR
ncbi:MAG: DUF4290 domain-containing protein [Tannerellaceae bacterium]|jgi:hypothetical protein|nr:DUF4290 domain-containing protein [Tannerellaceae bacterium]